VRAAFGTREAWLRTALATLGGYALAYAFTAAFARAAFTTGLLARADAAVVATLLGLLVLVAASVYAFGARSAVRAGVAIVGGAVGCFALAAVLR
jgi:hypothetical protein